MDVLDNVKIINPTDKLYNCIGKVIEICDFNVLVKVRVNFTGVDNCLRAGYSKQWINKFSEIGFFKTFELKDCETI